MSQPFYSQHYCAPNSYNTTQPPVSMTPHTPAYNDYYNSGVTPSAHTVDDSSVLAQSYTYPDVGYTPENNFSSYVSTHGQTPMVPHYPDSANQIPHQDVPGQCWTGPVQYTEVTTAQPNDLYDQRRGSCASSTSGNWYSQDEVNAGYYNHQQQNYHANHHSHVLQHQQQSGPTNFGMHSPTQYLRTQQLVHSAPAVHRHLEVVAPYGTLPVHEPKLERRESDAYQTLSDDSIGHSHPTQFSPFIQSHPPAAGSPAPSSVPDGDSIPNARGDLFAQQRRAVDYQYGLQVQQERKYQLSGQFEQFEANLVNDQEHAHHHHHQASSSNHTRPLPTPVVPSQARERFLSHTHSSPDAEDKKLSSPSKKPALACMFCRRRKIACGPPSPDNPDRTCNQCARRGQVCEYPTESRRGIRKAPKEPAPEEPTVHTFAHGDAPQREGRIGPIRRTRRKRAN